MLGVTTPAIGPTVAAVVARLEATPVAGLEERDGVLGVLDQALERGAAHQRAAQRAGRRGPTRSAARRAGTARARGRAPRRPGATSTRVAVTSSIAASARLVGLAAQRVGGDGGEVGLGARHRRAPVDAGDRRRPGRRRRRRAGRRRRSTTCGGGRSSGSSERQARPRGGWRAALDRWTSAPASTRARTCRSRPCGSPSVPTTATTTGWPTPASAGRQQRRRVRLGAVAEHDVEQQHAGRRVGRGPGEVLEAQGRVDHRVGPAGGEGVVAEVDERVRRGGQVGAERELGRERDVAPDRTERWRRRPASPRRTACRRRRARAGDRRRTPGGAEPATGHAGTVARPGGRSTRLGRRGQVGPRRPRAARARPGCRARRRTPRSRRRPRRPAAWRRARSARPRVRVEPAQSPRGWRARRTVGRQVAAADAQGAARRRRRRGRAGASSCWQPVPDAATMPTGPGETALAKPRPEPADDGGAAVGAHHEQPALGGGPLERDLLLDRHVVAEDHHVAAGVEGVHRLDQRARRRARRPAPGRRRCRRRALAVVRGGRDLGRRRRRGRWSAPSGRRRPRPAPRPGRRRRPSRSATTMSLGRGPGRDVEAHLGRAPRR